MMRFTLLRTVLLVAALIAALGVGAAVSAHPHTVETGNGDA
jgi:hypothetical protein